MVQAAVLLCVLFISTRLVLKLIPLRTSKMVTDALTESSPFPAFSKYSAIMFGQTPFVSTVVHSLHACGGTYVLSLGVRVFIVLVFFFGPTPSAVVQGGEGIPCWVFTVLYWTYRNRV